VALFENESPRRVKPLLYTYRVLLTGIHLMQSGGVEANLLRLNERFRLPYVPELVERKLAGTKLVTRFVTGACYQRAFRLPGTKQATPPGDGVACT
jgi:predicted nucleotidyltransferase